MCAPFRTAATTVAIEQTDVHPPAHSFSNFPMKPFREVPMMTEVSKLTRKLNPPGDQLEILFISFPKPIPGSTAMLSQATPR